MSDFSRRYSLRPDLLLDPSRCCRFLSLRLLDLAEVRLELVGSHSGAACELLGEPHPWLGSSALHSFLKHGAVLLSAAYFPRSAFFLEPELDLSAAFHPRAAFSTGHFHFDLLM